MNRSNFGGAIASKADFYFRVSAFCRRVTVGTQYVIGAERKDATQMSANYQGFNDASQEFDRSELQRQLPGLQGRILIIDDDGCRSPIYSQFVHLSGNGIGRIVVIPAATADPIECGRSCARTLREFGAGLVGVLHMQSPAIADDANVVALLTQATGVLLLGQDHAQLHVLLGRSRALQALRQRHREGCVVAATRVSADLVFGSFNRLLDSRETGDAHIVSA